MTGAQTERAIRSEFRQWLNQPRPQKDWDIIWVLTGYDTSWNTGSDTRRRLEEGMRLAKKIAKINRGKSPSIYISGYDEHNANLKKWRMEGLFEEKYSFPKKNVLIGPLEHILHTGDQFKLFPRKFLKGNKRIVVVTDAYHIPRVERYVEKFFPQERERFVFYPVPSAAPSAVRIKKEVQNIIKYSQKGIIPLFIKSARKKVVVTGATGLLGSCFLNQIKHSKK